MVQTNGLLAEFCKVIILILLKLNKNKEYWIIIEDTVKSENVKFLIKGLKVKIIVK